MFVKNLSVHHFFKQFRGFVPVITILLTLTACNLGISGPSVKGGSGSTGATDRGGSSRSSSHIPIAVADEVITDPFEPISINVLSNDFGLADLPITVSISSLPDYGNIAVEADNTVVFTPNSSYTGKDSFAYVVRDNNGDTATAIVSLDIRCSGCNSDSLISLQWLPNTDRVDGYIVEYGPSEYAAMQIASTLYNNSGLFDPDNPAVQLDVYDDLGLNQGESVCFRIRAFNANSASAPSAPMCTII